jgi:tRNA nucleotidyltransferase (CCA-adding enzyme)
VGDLLDFFRGVLDLQARQIRVLHPNSFIEDPTRIYRAVRFAVRLGFEIEPTTEGYIRYAIASGIYNQPQGDSVARPALQTRLKSELKYILQAPYWKAALRLLASLGALQCIHPTLELDNQLWRQLRLLECCLRRLNSKHSLSDWLLRLEVMLAHLSPEDRGKVAANLQLPDDSIKRLQIATQAEVTKSLLLYQMPSQVVRQLRRYDLPTLILLAVQSPRSIRHKIWQYLTDWANVQPPLNGNDLKALGYKPGPQYRQILEDLLAATLDGVIGGSKASPPEIRASAEVFLLAHYPRY